MLATLALFLGLPLTPATKPLGVPHSSRSLSTPPPSLGSHEDESNDTEIIRLNETCVVRNSSKVQVFRQNSTLMHVYNNKVVSMARLIQSDKDPLILNHDNIDFPSLSLSARTPNVSKEHMEEFKAHLHCLGFTEEDVFYTSREHACPLPGKQTGEGNADPQLG